LSTLWTKRQLVFPVRDVGHVDVDVDDEIRDLLDHDPRDGIGPKLLCRILTRSLRRRRPPDRQVILAAASAGMETKRYIGGRRLRASS